MDDLVARRNEITSRMAVLKQELGVLRDNVPYGRPQAWKHEVESREIERNNLWAELRDMAPRIEPIVTQLRDDMHSVRIGLAALQAQVDKLETERQELYRRINAGWDNYATMQDKLNELTKE